MCPACRAEYEDPADRRFHAQPNACPVCGPRALLLDARGGLVLVEDPVAEAARLLGRGEIVAVKGLGGFHLAADAADEDVLARLRAAKAREEKPFAVMARDLETARKIAAVSPDEEALLCSPRRPIVLLRKLPGGSLADNVAPSNPFVGVMLPYTPLHHLLLAESPPVLVMTSGNKKDEPIAVENTEALARLSGIAGRFLAHDRPIQNRADDSVMMPVAGKARFLRRSRGFVPEPVILAKGSPPVIGVGAHLKNTVCLAIGRRAYLSPHVGDLETPLACDFFEEVVNRLSRILDFRPEIAAHDPHPDYFPTRYALALPGVRTVAVQHHHAHICSVLAENGQEGPVIGLALDGAGQGSDGAVWGGEVLISTLSGFTRAAHLSYVPLPGGDRAAREPWRMAASHLEAAFGADFQRLDLPLFRSLPEGKLKGVMGIMDKSTLSPPTSSMGRLFDAVAAVTGLRLVSTYEGQAALDLTSMVDMAEEGFYDFSVTRSSPRVMETAPIIEGVVRDVLNRAPIPLVAARFHNTLVNLLASVCRDIRRETGIRACALSGGVFQNPVLLARLSSALERDGFTVLTHSVVPSNDGGLSLGQAAAAAAMAK